MSRLDYSVVSSNKKLKYFPVGYSERQTYFTNSCSIMSNFNIPRRRDPDVCAMERATRVHGHELGLWQSKFWICERREIFNINFYLKQFLATVFVLVNLFGQLGGCALVIARYRVTIACGVLFFIVVLQVRFSYWN